MKHIGCVLGLTLGAMLAPVYAAAADSTTALLQAPRGTAVAEIATEPLAAAQLPLGQAAKSFQTPSGANSTVGTKLSPAVLETLLQPVKKRR